jgi:ribosome production factor 1
MSQDEMEDEFEGYFNGTLSPKILVTTRPRPSKELFAFIGDLLQLVPNAYFYPRKSFTVRGTHN